MTIIITRQNNEDKLLVCSLLPDLQHCLHRGNNGAVRWINDILFRTSSRNVVEKESCISKETVTPPSSRDPVGPGSGWSWRRGERRESVRRCPASLPYRLAYFVYNVSFNCVYSFSRMESAYLEWTWRREVSLLWWLIFPEATVRHDQDCCAAGTRDHGTVSTGTGTARSERQQNISQQSFYPSLQRVYLSLPFGLISDKTSPRDPVWEECQDNNNL